MSFTDVAEWYDKNKDVLDQIETALEVLANDTLHATITDHSQDISLLHNKIEKQQSTLSSSLWRSLLWNVFFLALILYDILKPKQ